jgi:hypothetical protein
MMLPTGRDCVKQSFDFFGWRALRLWEGRGLNTALPRPAKTLGVPHRAGFTFARARRMMSRSTMDRIARVWRSG